MEEITYLISKHQKVLMSIIMTIVTIFHVSDQCWDCVWMLTAQSWNHSWDCQLPAPASQSTCSAPPDHSGRTGVCEPSDTVDTDEKPSEIVLCIYYYHQYFIPLSPDSNKVSTVRKLRFLIAPMRTFSSLRETFLRDYTWSLVFMMSSENIQM